MANAVFSISTENYSKNAQVSIESFVKNCEYKVDVFNLTIKNIIQDHCNNTIQKFIDKYNKDPNILRWSLKPAMLIYFLTDKKYDNVIYIDNDIYFNNNATFLIDDTRYGILLTKHNRPIYPSGNPEQHNQFLCNFTDGFFNAGFVGASHNGLEALTWWSSMNYWQCTKAKYYGLFDDQKYLDIMALQFYGCIKICEHPGCNLAVWNSQAVVRHFEKNRWKINESYDPIFCHFSGINNQMREKDPMLHDFYIEYIDSINNLKS